MTNLIKGDIKQLMIYKKTEKDIYYAIMFHYGKHTVYTHGDIILYRGIDLKHMINIRIYDNFLKAYNEYEQL